MWAAGSLASVAMITYPAISALVSCNAESDQQGKSAEFSMQLYPNSLVFIVYILWFCNMDISLLYFPWDPCVINEEVGEYGEVRMTLTHIR